MVGGIAWEAWREHPWHGWASWRASGTFQRSPANAQLPLSHERICTIGTHHDISKNRVTRNALLRPDRFTPSPSFPFPLEFLLVVLVLLLVMRKQRIQIGRLARLNVIRRPGVEDPVSSITLANCPCVPTSFPRSHLHFLSNKPHNPNECLMFYMYK